MCRASGNTTRIDREDGTFRAKKVTVRRSQRDERKLVGRIESFTGGGVGYGVIRLLGLDVIVNESTELVDARGRTRPLVGRRLLRSNNPTWTDRVTTPSSSRRCPGSWGCSRTSGRSWRTPS